MVTKNVIIKKANVYRVASKIGYHSEHRVVVEQGLTSHQTQRDHTVCQVGYMLGFPTHF